MTNRTVSMSTQDRLLFGHAPLVGRHALADHPLFTNEALVALLDAHPREHLFALAMGTDPDKPSENQSANHTGVSGAQLLQAVARGRLWLNITHVDRAHPPYRELVHNLYAHLAGEVPALRASVGKATLLVSSPGAVVYYHVDGPPSLLWHVRGRKRVWVYPALDERFVSREHLEDIFAGAAHEYVPYTQELDARATVLDLAPGDVACWPQNAPHRVSNLDGINVSLSTEHFTPQSRRRARLYCANRFLRVVANFRPASTAETGAAAVVKTGIHKVWQLAGRDPTVTKRHTATVRVDPDAPLGWTRLAPLPA